MTAPRRVIYLTGTRADFGLMQATLRRIAATPGVALEIAVTGMHLQREWGHTVDEVRASGLPICAEIPVELAGRNAEGMAVGVADCLRGLTRVLAPKPPDMMLLLGDRGEMLAGAIAALHLGVCCAHVHGGERSGTVDEPVRHAISKLSSYHFVATQASRERLLRMGEDEGRIFVSGAPGLDELAALGQLPRDECLKALGLAPGARFVLAVFHPVVQQAGQAAEQTRALLHALRRAGLPVVWLEPNSDAGAGEILRVLEAEGLPAGSRRITHLPRPLFAAAMRHCEVLVGNSSAGIIEAATFGTPVVDVGDRQRMRDRGANVMDAPAQAQAIEAALLAQLGHGRWPCDNPWGDGQAAGRIAHWVASLPVGGAVLEKINSY